MQDLKMIEELRQIYDRYHDILDAEEMRASMQFFVRMIEHEQSKPPKEMPE